jgi:hypothetical protein
MRHLGYALIASLPLGCAVPAGSVESIDPTAIAVEPEEVAPAVPVEATATGDPEAIAPDPVQYAVRLADLEAQVDALKEQVRTSHTRICALGLYDFGELSPPVEAAPLASEEVGPQ